jgi:hypothetical protein
VLVLALAVSARAGQAATPSLDVLFSATGSITVTLPNGSPVGVTAGAPTVIPAGYYTLLLSGPGGCTELPYFELTGPGVNVLDDLQLGELSAGDTVDFQPDSTYTWTDTGANPAVTYIFATSATVESTAPAPTPSVSNANGGVSQGTRSTTSSQDIVGSALATFRGTLSALVGSTGRITLAFDGRAVRTLLPGRYTVAVDDHSATNGLALEQVGHKPLSVSGVAFVGRHSLSVDLSGGQWFVSQRPAGKKYFFFVAG